MTTNKCPRAAYVINSDREIGVDRRQLATRMVFKAKTYYYRKLFYWTQWRTFRLFIAFFIDLLTALGGARGFAALVLLHRPEWLIPEDILALLVIIWLVVQEYSKPALFFGGKATTRSSKFIISASCVESPSLLLRELFFGEVF